jgi:hypothetical protein
MFNLTNIKIFVKRHIVSHQKHVHLIICYFTHEVLACFQSIKPSNCLRENKIIILELASQLAISVSLQKLIIVVFFNKQVRRQFETHVLNVSIAGSNKHKCMSSLISNKIAKRDSSRNPLGLAALHLNSGLCERHIIYRRLYPPLYLQFIIKLEPIVFLWVR